MSVYPVCDTTMNASVIGTAATEAEALRLIREHFTAQYPGWIDTLTKATVIHVLLATHQPHTRERLIQAWVGSADAR